MIKKSPFLLALLGLVLMAGLGFGGWRAYGQAFAPTPTAAAQSGYSTTAVTRGDLSAAINASGVVVARRTADLAFSVSGTLGELDVQPGDPVAQGQKLAALGNTNTAELELAVRNQELAVRQAEQVLQDLQTGGQAALAQAQSNVAAAETAVATAQKNLRSKGVQRCDTTTLQTYYQEYLHDKQQADIWQGYLDDGNTGYGKDYILENLNPLKAKRDKAYINYTYCQGYTDQEVAVSHASLQTAQANLEQAQATYQSLLAGDGVDPVAVQQAQARLDSAKLQLAAARQDLAGAAITAPFVGTVLSVSATPGDRVGTSALITVADLSEPQVQVHVDETDLASFAVGCSAAVTFDSLPNQSFTGRVAEIDPTLISSGGVDAAQGLIDLDGGKTASGKDLPLGLNAAVELTCREAADTLLVPTTAVYAPIDGPAYVYVLDAQGRPEKRVVTLGVGSLASTQVLAGLSEGERVITSTVN